MKNQSIIPLALALFIIVGCKSVFSQSRIYATFSGKIKNNTAKKVILKGHSRYLPNNWQKVIEINADGTFKDTLKLVNVEDSKKMITDIVYVFSLDDKPIGIIFLENGQNLEINIDAKDRYAKNVTFKGSGAPNNNYFKDKGVLLEKMFGNTFETASPSFIKKGNEKEQLENLRKELKALLEKYNISKLMYEREKMNDEEQLAFFEMTIGKGENNRKGQESVGFVYKNYKGGKTSLEDLKGKYLYIDVWATWCGPCIYEVPYLKKIEKKYHHKNIAFVSISLDSDEQAWRKMISDKKLGGVQLFANVNDTSHIDKFLESFKVLGIPRFILLDPQGKIVHEHAPRPSQPKLQELLDNLLK